MLFGKFSLATSKTGRSLSLRPDSCAMFSSALQRLKQEEDLCFYAPLAIKGRGGLPNQVEAVSMSPDLASERLASFICLSASTASAPMLR